MKRWIHSRPWIYAECVVLMLLVPLLLATLVPMRYMLPSLWLVMLYCHLILRRMPGRCRWGWHWERVTRAALRPLLMRFAVSTALLCALVLWLTPDLWLGFVSTNPVFWALVMLLYPLLSVIPQEMIFRPFFFARYEDVWRCERHRVIASGLLFGAAHLIFYNWVAPVLCVIGGLMFAQTYARTRSLALVVIEHALYGCMIFTIGLGRYFYHGAAGG